MRKIADRAVACLLIVLFMLGGFSIYLGRFFKDGGDWAAFPVNRHSYSDALLSVGSILDRNGKLLSTMKNQSRVFNEYENIRRSSLHVVGDTKGNIGTGALSFFANELMGYSPVNGVFSVDGKGCTLRLSIDSELNAAAYEALAGRRGAVVFYNYKTGEVLCMVSAPTFDPYSPPDEEQLKQREYEGAYINRCVSSSFTPGSVFKVVTLTAAIENIPELFEMEFYCPGYTDIGGERINCSGFHGHCDIYDAFANSCNVAFAQLSLILGGETLKEYTANLGLLDSFQMSGIPVAKGGFTVAPDGSGDLSWSGIGQYENTINPLAMARLMAAVAGGGVAVSPRIVKSVVNELGIPKYIGYQFRHSERLMKKTTADTLSEMLRYNTKNVYSDYYHFSEIEGLSAKSGTAELRDGAAPHAWFTGFLANDKYPVAFTVIVENAGWGLQQAAPVADRVIMRMMGHNA